MIEDGLVVDPKFFALLPPHSKQQRAQLEANIQQEARVRDPILFWYDGKQNLIVEGMRRYEIATRLKIPYHTEPIAFKDREEAELWICLNALGRRNLTEENESRLVGWLYNRYKGRQGGPRIGSAPSNGNGQGMVADLVDGWRDVADAIANKTGKHKGTVKRAGAAAEIEAKLAVSVRKALADGTVKAALEVRKALAELDHDQQAALLKQVLGGEVRSLRAALGIKPKAGKRKAKRAEGGAEPAAPSAGYEQIAAEIQPQVLALAPSEEELRRLAQYEPEDQRAIVEALGPALPTLAEAVQAFDDGEVATCRHDSKLSCAYCEQLYCESCSPDHEGDCRARELVKARSALGVLIRFCQQAQLKGKWLPHTDALAKLLEQSP